MASYNKVILVGNLTRDPQVSYLPSQTAVCEFGLAVNHRWKGQDGQQHDETCFIDCNIYGRQAEVFKQYMAKGRSVLVEGRLRFDTWEGKDGTKRSKHRVFVERFTFLGQGGGNAAGQGSQRAPAAASAGAPPPEEYDGPPAMPEEPGGDNIPF